MPSTPSGIVYPTSTDHTRLWEHLETLAETTDAAVAAATAALPKPQAGVSGQWASIAAGGSGDLVVTFPQAFAAPPIVLTTSLFQFLTVAVLSTTSTNVTLRARNYGSAASVCQCNWLAYPAPAA